MKRSTGTRLDRIEKALAPSSRMHFFRMQGDADLTAQIAAKRANGEIAARDRIVVVSSRLPCANENLEGATWIATGVPRPGDPSEAIVGEVATSRRLLGA